MISPVSRLRSQRSRRGPSKSRDVFFRRQPLVIWGAVLGLAAAWLMAIADPVTHSTLAAGQKSPMTLLAAVDFICADLDRTELARRQAAEHSLPVFAPNLRRVQEGAREFHRFFTLVQTRAQQPGRTDEFTRELIELAGVVEMQISVADMLRLVENSEPGGSDALMEALSAQARKGILTEEERAGRFKGIASADAIWLDRGADLPLVERKLADIATPDVASEEAARQLAKITPWNRIRPDSIRRLIRPWMEANLDYQPVVTDQRRHDAAQRVEPLMMTVRSGATLIEAGKVATLQTLEMLREHDRRRMEMLPPYRRVLNLLADIGLAFLVTGLVVLLLGQSEQYRNAIGRSRALFVLSSILTVVAVRALLWLSESGAYASSALITLALPISVSAILVTILSDSTAGVLSGLWVSVIASIFLGRNFDMLLIGLFSSGVAALVCRKIRRRGQLFQAGLWIGLTRAALALLADLPMQQPVSVLGMRMATALGVGLAESALILLLIPLFEFGLRLTSNIRLLELSDPGHPLLRRMAEEVPGTYHHSLMVAHLAESAAEQIGANPLLARVCAYFHDIGKLTKPEYFIENSALPFNPHDELTPSMSNLVIQSHVKEGVALAQRYRLPPPVLDAIRQHHGTSLVSCFYNRARIWATESGVSPAPVEADYRYGGPRPVCREQGILLLADSVEAASRTLESASPVRIRTLVDEIVAGKLRDGQLDDAALTLADLTAIKESFAFTLANMRHGRIAYPSHENTTPESPTPGSRSAGAADPTDRLDTATSADGTVPVG